MGCRWSSGSSTGFCWPPASQQHPKQDDIRDPYSVTGPRNPSPFNAVKILLLQEMFHCQALGMTAQLLSPEFSHRQVNILFAMSFKCHYQLLCLEQYIKPSYLPRGRFKQTSTPDFQSECVAQALHLLQLRLRPYQHYHPHLLCSLESETGSMIRKETSSSPVSHTTTSNADSDH